ncbi:hypothetical protein WJX73_010384 [Symbiochloris irregularis]|uniref:Cyclic nucleotide-binding domain-containing protein n=1 Tax=Symbiochloris irregularis TaxID=706552 RepID=A0AAW1NPQ1_9CHLO
MLSSSGWERNSQTFWPLVSNWLASHSLGACGFMDPVTPNRIQLRQLAKDLAKRRGAELHAQSTREIACRPFAEALPQLAQHELVKAHQQQRHDLLKTLNARAAHIHPFFSVDPEGMFRRLWDFIAVVLILFLAWYIPLLVAYMGETGCIYLHCSSERRNDASGLATSFDLGYQIVLIVTNAFFLADIFINFFTGVETAPDSPVDYELFAMWSAYTRTWFPLDAVACLPLECMLQSWAPNAYWWNTGHLLRLFRCWGITRRCKGSPLAFLDRWSTKRKEFSFSLRRLVLTSMLSLYACHIFSCFEWWTLRLEKGGGSLTWVQPGQLDIIGTSICQYYVWSMFNSISAMIMLTYGSYPPITWPEAITWTFMMVIVASVFLVDSGQYVPYFLSLAVKRSNFKLQMDNVLAAVEGRRLPDSLAKLIIRHLRLKYKFTGLTNPDRLWQELPYSMQVEMAETLGRPSLLAVPLFLEFPSLLDRTCLLLKDTYALAGEEFVKQGWPSRTMYFVQSGVVLLYQDGVVAEAVLPGQFFGGDALLHPPTDEALLQATGVKRSEVTRYADSFEALATAKAAVDCRLLSLDRVDFLELAIDDRQSIRALEQMAIRHVQRMLGSKAQQGTEHPL